jgi:hypothetical protein
MLMLASGGNDIGPFVHAAKIGLPRITKLVLLGE